MKGAEAHILLAAEALSAIDPVAIARTWCSTFKKDMGVHEISHVVFQQFGPHRSWYGRACSLLLKCQRRKSHSNVSYMLSNGFIVME